MDTLKLAKEIRKDVVFATSKAKAGHVGSNLSIADIMAVLYGKIMRKNKPPYQNNSFGTPNVFYDKFVLSKGHAGLSVYSTLAELGVLNKKELLDTYYQSGSKFSGHMASFNNAGVELSTGSLGQGVGVAVGLALALKKEKSDARVYTLVGNGELNEGSVWESAMFARAHKLSNLTIIVDDNKLQAMGESKKVLDMGSIVGKFLAFGCNAYEIDGHDHEALANALTWVSKDKPTVIVAHTIKGKGVAEMENNNDYHSKYVSAEDLPRVLAEIEGK